MSTTPFYARRHRGLPVLAALVIGLLPWNALAQQPSRAPAPTAHVVALDNGDVIVNLSASQGIAVGDVVELWRPIKVRHPVTGRALEDKFRIGALRIKQVGEALSLTEASGTMERPPASGDIVVLPPKEAPQPPLTTVPSGAPPAATPAPPAPAADSDAQEVIGLFESLTGKSPVARIRAYEDYVRRKPNSKYAAVLYEEAHALRRLFDRKPCAETPTEMRLANFEGPKSVPAETPLNLGLETAGDVAGAVAHVRNAGEVAYVPSPMQPAGPGYWTVVIPAERVRSPRLEYFIEGSSPSGETKTLVGSADQPRKASVYALPTVKPPASADATVSILTDYADYNRLRGNDYAWQTEGSFGMRYGDVGVRAFRSGFGVYRGAGGSIDDLDEEPVKAARAVGLTYGYLETELAGSESVSVIIRGLVGLRDDGTSGGGLAMIRLGNDKSTNLMVGGEVLGGVGLRGITQLELNVFPRVPIVLRSEVSNQPAGVSDDDPRREDDSSVEEISTSRAEVGARGIVQVGYRVVPSFTIALRGSYQGRTINHAGPGFGAGMTYQW